MATLFRVFISLSNSDLALTGQYIGNLVGPIGFELLGMAPHRGLTSATWQKNLNELSRADLFLGLYSQRADYSSGGLLYHDPRHALHAQSGPRPLQQLEYEWAQQLRLPMILWVIDSTPTSPDQRWHSFVRQIQQRPHSRHLASAQQWLEHLHPVALQQWAALLLAACWRGIIHPDIPPKITVPPLLAL